MRRTAILIGLLSSIALVNGQNVTITFDPPLLPGGGILIHGAYIEKGVRFGDANHWVSQCDGRLAGRPDNGSAYLTGLIGAPVGAPFSFVNNALFRLVQFEVAEYSDVFASPQFGQLLGHRSDGSVVQFDFYTDGIFDGTGPLPDFETIVLPESFTNLRWVEFGYATGETGAIAIDNVSLSVVPEPSSFALMTVAVLVLVRAGRGRA